VPSERKLLCEAIVEEASGAVPVLVGVGAESTYVACDLARHAEQAGADGVVIMPPVTGACPPDRLRDYFVAVAGSVSVPAMIQDAPEYVGVGLGPELVNEIAAQASQVRYLKVETGADGLLRWLREVGDTLSVFCGSNGIYTLDCLRLGAVGIIPGLDLLDMLLAIYAAEQAGDRERAETLFARFLPMAAFEMQDIDHYNACAKHVLARRGVEIGPGLRPPAGAVTPETLALLDRYLDALPLDEVQFVHRV
jgi:4-hydroxy-tetrahydrodipicolinate synthase